MLLVQLFYNSVSSELSGTWVWAEAGWSFYCESLSPKGGNQGSSALDPRSCGGPFFFSPVAGFHSALSQLFFVWVAGLHMGRAGGRVEFLL